MAQNGIQVIDPYGFIRTIPKRNTHRLNAHMKTAVFQRSYDKLIQGESSHRMDWINPVCMAILGIVGVFFIYSAQVYNEGTLWKRQIIWLFMGAGLYIAVSFLNYKRFLDKALWIYLLGIALLLVVLSPLGISMYGAQRWINLGFMNFQPTEAAKIATLIMVASVLARHPLGDLRDSLTALFIVGLLFCLPIVLIFLQPDLGSTLVFPPMVFAMLYVSNLSKRFFVTAIALFTLAVSVMAFDVYSYYSHMDRHGLDLRRDAGAYQDQSLLPLRDYQRNRILGFVAPELVDPRGTGIAWNAIQATISVASGGLTGKGFANGTQAQLGYLPQSVAHNDFIYAVIAEETGFIGSVTVILLFAILIGNGFRIAGQARDLFGMLLAVGVSVIFLVHVFINIGMTLGITPITGLPLPFLSYGGSFVLSCCILQGLIQSVHRYRKDFS